MNVRTNLSTPVETDPQKLHLWVRVSTSFYPSIPLVPIPILTPHIGNVTWTENLERCIFDLHLSSTAFAFDGKAGSISSDSTVWDASNSTTIPPRSRTPSFASRSNVTIEGCGNSRSKAKLDLDTLPDLCRHQVRASSVLPIFSLICFWKSANRLFPISNQLGDIRLGINLEKSICKINQNGCIATTTTPPIKSTLRNL